MAARLDSSLIDRTPIQDPRAIAMQVFRASVEALSTLLRHLSRRVASGYILGAVHGHHLTDRRSG
jgi:hypothetical protein